MDAVFLRNRDLTWESDDVMRSPYKKSDLVYICISTTARAISQVPIEVGQQVKEDEYKPLPKNDPWQQLFERPNYLMDRYSFVEATVGHLMLDGDIFIVPFPPNSSKPISLWVIPKRFLGPIRDTSGGGKTTNQLIGWNYNPGGVVYSGTGGTILGPNSIPLRTEEVCHIYFWNPDDPIMGQAPHEAGRLSVMVDYKASHYTANFFDEGAVPGGMLQTDKSLSDKQFKRILDQFESKHGSYRHSHRLAILENGLKYTQTGLSQKDMEFPKLRDLSADRVFQIYGMKKAVISETADINYATSREQRKEWWESTNLPIMRMAASALNFTLFPSPALRLRCAFNTNKIEALRESLKDKTDTGYRLWQMGACFNEINQRMDLGFKKQPWGDVWYMPVNLVPVTDSNAPSQEEAVSELENKGSSLIPYKKDIRELRKETLWNGFIKRIAPLEELYTKKISRVFYDMRKRTLELLYQEKKSIIDVVKDMDDVDKEPFMIEYHTLDKVTSPLYVTALELGVQLIIEETGLEISFNLADPESVYFLTNKKLKIQGVIQTVKNQISIQLNEAYRLGENVEQAADRIRSVFDVAKSRARAIARTEIGGASNEGRFIAMNKSGFTEQEWFTALDERVRPTHQAMQGKIIKMGEMWVLPSGASLRHPGDYNGPPQEIINCRCIAVVVPESHSTND
jgi:SPP1 gp7 family putative phage head morphogenesis protein